MYTLAALVAAFVVLGAATASATRQDCRTRACAKRGARHCRQHPACMARVQRKRERRLWRYYRAHPMPYCTWGPESGGNYRARNPRSTAGGKYQILDGTWHTYGGPDYPGHYDAAQAQPLLQEMVARRVLAGQGIHAWVGC